MIFSARILKAALRASATLGAGSHVAAKVMQICLAALRGGSRRWQATPFVVAHGGVSRALRGLLLDLPKLQVPSLPVPQDKVLVVARGSVSWL
jgi:broad specificity phosphatase PhoE